ncbi:MAG TPA: TOPRIM nucleotidyl transferase/hydrolase domain-containing protein [Gaiellaceae bacterium]|nr:TOPRIM nucleotidyl transferase/hydrolase domain-containing protein [Gaiellaceae bacterium]
MPLLDSVRIRGYRSAGDVELTLGALTALVGEARTGKSNILRAVRQLLDPEAPLLGPEDVRRDDVETIEVEARLAGGGRVSLAARPPGRAAIRREGAPPALFLPAAERAGRLVAAEHARGSAGEVLRRFEAALAEPDGGESSAAPAGALVAAIEACCEAGIEGLVLLVEEPELFLRPQAQRYLHRRLRAFAEAGNQVLYSTHAPAFLNVARLEELVLVSYDPERGTRIVQPEPLDADEAFRVVSEFDAERSELFLARAALLVEGRTEKLVLPAIFAALGHDADGLEISIVECGGKSNIPVFARICTACGIPFVALHDRDAEPGSEPIPAEAALNRLIAEVAGPERTIVLEPDFEAVAGLRGHSHKPERAWRHFSEDGAEVPAALARAVRLVVEAAATPAGRGRRRRGAPTTRSP